MLSLSATSLWAQRTEVSIHGTSFYINDTITYAGRYWDGHRVEGLLMNSRMVNGIFDDRNQKTAPNFAYPDTGEWSAERNTDEFIAAMEEWHSYGLLAFTLNLQGGSPMGYGNHGWINSAFNSDGSLDMVYMERLGRVLKRADELGMVVILGYFYFGADEYLEDNSAVERAVDNATEWILESGYGNVMVEIANECDIYYNHSVLQPENIWKLIQRVKGTSKDGRRLLVSTSFSGSKVPTDRVIALSDYVLLHGNGVSEPSAMRSLIERTRKVDTYTPKPIVINEDDHYNFDSKESNLSVSVEEYASWGYFDFRRGGEEFEEGFQSIPASWAVDTERKRDFFEKVKEITNFGAAPEFFSNPILSGYHPDPSLCRVGEYYYMVNSSFEWWPAIPIHRSRDLVSWELIGYGVTDPEKLTLKDGLRSNGGIYAVTIRHHEGLFYIITTDIDGIGNFYITATDPAGEWSAPIELNSPGIDPSLFWDDDGKCYYVGHGRLHEPADWPQQQGAWAQELDTKAGKLVGPRVQLTHGHASNAVWTEGPHIYKRDGKYLLLVAEGGTSHEHSVTLFQSDSILGEYTPHHINPILTHRHLGRSHWLTAVGHADIVETQSGEWWMVALGIRNFENNAKFLARETFLTPMKFENNGEAVGIIVNEGIGQVLEVERRPKLPYSPYLPTDSREDFSAGKLSLHWNMLRSPMEQWYSFKDGRLLLECREQMASQTTNPSLLTRRIGATQFSAETSVELLGRAKGEEAGVILYRDEQSFIAFVRRGDELVAYSQVDDTQSEIARVPYSSKGEVKLRMRSDGHDVIFLYGDSEEAMERLDGSAPLYIISDRRGGQFNGPMVGIYATSSGVKSRVKAAFSYFDYKEGVR